MITDKYNEDDYDDEDDCNDNHPDYKAPDKKLNIFYYDDSSR